jgi:hypothetical protein
MNIKDYLHYYLGQQVLINNGIHENKIDHLTYVHHLGDCGGHQYEWLAKDCQLILRSLEDMTEEEARGYLSVLPVVREYLSHDEYGVYWRSLGVSSAVMMFNYGPVECFHYLLSKGFDLFALIPAGMAIDAKTLTTV